MAYIRAIHEPDAPHPFSVPRLPALEHAVERTLPDHEVPKLNPAQAERLYPATLQQ